MSQIFTDALQNLIDAPEKMPGVGPKSVQRIVFWVLQTDPENIKNPAATPQTAKDMIRFCETCGNITRDLVCQICVDPRCDRSLICMVGEAENIASLEKTRSYRGLYHVLGGVVDPINGIEPDQLRIRFPMGRLQDTEVREIIIATNPDMEGEATAIYLSRSLTTLQVPALRLVNGLPMGSNLEYADKMTPSRALEGRHSLE